MHLHGRPDFVVVGWPLARPRVGEPALYGVQPGVDAVVSHREPAVVGPATRDATNRPGVRPDVLGGGERPRGNQVVRARTRRAEAVARAVFPLGFVPPVPVPGE